MSATLDRTDLERLTRHGATLCLFTSHVQMDIITDLAFGEEGKFFIDKVEEYAERINKMPVTYEQDGKGDEAIAYLHYFVGGCDWYITEKDKGDGSDTGTAAQIQAFGMCRLQTCDDFELGYISIEEICRCGAELDLHFTTLGKIREQKESHGEEAE